MKIIAINPTDTSYRKLFCQLPFRIYKDFLHWVPPLQGEIESKFDRKKNPFYRHSEAAFFLALDSSGDPLGRIAVLDNRNYNDFNKEKTAFFTLFESFNNQDVSTGLFDAAIEWACSRGLTKVLGPRGFSALDGLGMLVKGFEFRPAFGIPYNPDYYPTLLESSGFRISGADIASGYLDTQSPFPREKIHEFSRRVQEKKGLKVVNFHNRQDLRRLVPKLKDLYNGSLGGTSDGVPLTDEEAKQMADQLIWFADPRLIKILYKDERPVGFLFAYPDISAAVRRHHGKLWPFGWADYLLERNRTKWINVNGAGIIEEYRGQGGTAILFSEMWKSVEEGGRFTGGDIVQIGEDNTRMQNELEGLGITFHKKHRMYAKTLL
jgi:GNAT superfamily N-acetyltransferase